MVLLQQYQADALGGSLLLCCRRAAVANAQTAPTRIQNFHRARAIKCHPARGGLKGVNFVLLQRLNLARCGLPSVTTSTLCPARGDCGPSRSERAHTTRPPTTRCRGSRGHSPPSRLPSGLTERQIVATESATPRTPRWYPLLSASCAEPRARNASHAAPSSRCCGFIAAASTRADPKNFVEVGHIAQEPVPMLAVRRLDTQS